MAGHDSWMPIYIGDYLGDTTHLTCCEHGAYLLLIFHQWTSRKPIPDDDNLMARITRQTVPDWIKMKPNIVSFFTVVKGGLLQKRTDIEAKRAESKYKKQVEAGKKTAFKRKQLSSSPEANHGGNHVANHHARPGTTTTTKVVRDQPGPSQQGPGSGSGLRHPDRSSTTVDDRVFHVVPETGCEIRIHPNGIVDVIGGPRDCEVPEFTPAEAIALRQQILDDRKHLERAGQASLAFVPPPSV